MNSALIFAIGCLVQFLLIVLLDRLLPGPTAEYTNFVLREGVLTIPVSSTAFKFQVGDEVSICGETRKIVVVNDNTFVIEST